MRGRWGKFEPPALNRFQHAKRPPAPGQRALAVSLADSAFGQVVEKTRLKRLQRTLLLAEKVGVCPAFSFSPAGEK